MKKSTRASATEPSRSEQLERLADAVNRLADEVRVARDVVDEFRTDFAWLLQNGMPHQPQEFVVVKRMARDPLAADWNERLVVERFPVPKSQAAQPSLSQDDLEAVALEMQSAFVGIAEGQLEIVLTELDELRQRILTALAHQDTEPADSLPAQATANAHVTDSGHSSSKQGQLF